MTFFSGRYLIYISSWYHQIKYCYRQISWIQINKEEDKKKRKEGKSQAIKETIKDQIVLLERYEWVCGGIFERRKLINHTFSSVCHKIETEEEKKKHVEMLNIIVVFVDKQMHKRVLCFVFYEKVSPWINQCLWIHVLLSVRGNAVNKF